MEQGTFLSKTIGIVIAVVVAAVVLIPICNSIVDNGGEGGNGGGDYEVVNSLQSSFDDPLLTFSDSLKSFQIYDVDQTPPMKSGYTLTLSDLNGYMDSIEIEQGSMYDGRSVSIVRMMIDEDVTLTVDGNEVQVTGGMDLNVFRSRAYVQPLGSDRMYDDNNLMVNFGSVSDYATRWDWALIDTENLNHDIISQFNLTIGTDYGFELSVVGSDHSLSVSADAVHIEYISEDEVGWVMPMYLDTEVFKVAEGSNIFFFDIYNIDYVANATDSYYSASGASLYSLDTGYTANGQIPLTFDVTVSEGITFTENWTIDVADSVLDLQSMNMVDHSEVSDVSVRSYDSEHSIYAVSTINGNPYETSSGGSGSSSDLGAAGTIIKVIPIFVILGIIMGTVGLFYQSRKEI